MSKIRSLAQKIVLSALSFLVLFLSLALPVKAQDAATSEIPGTWYDQTPYEWYTKVYDEDFSSPSEIFGERYTAAQVQWVIYSIPSIFLNFVTGQNHQLVSCLMGANFIYNTGQPTVDVDTCGKGFLTALQKLMSFKVIPSLSMEKTRSTNPDNLLSAVFQERELSAFSYFKNLGKKFHLIPRAEAAETGFGFGALGPINDIWKATRNLSYAVFTLIIVVFAFMIMFRIKLNPQTVITIQSALPKIIISMVLVTFSYAIAGLMVDLMYVVMGFFSAVVASSSLGFMGNNPVTYFQFLSGGLNNSMGGIANLVEGPIALILFFLAYLLIFIVSIIWTAIAAFAGLDLGAFGVGVILLVFWLILIFILIINIFRIFYMLFKTLATIYITVILGPIQIALGTIVPGMGFGAWIKKLIANLAVFPAFGILFYLAFFFLLQSFSMGLKTITDNNFLGDIVQNLSYLFGGDMQNFFMGNATPGGIWNPPWLGHASLPIAFLLMSVGCIMAIPSVVKAIESFMAGKEFVGTGIGEALGPLNRPLQGLAGVGTEYGSAAAQYWLANRRIVQNIENRSPQWLQQLIRSFRQSSGAKAGQS